jgi:hypothetical protein
LVFENPAVIELRFELADACDGVGRWQLELGHPDSAVPWFKKSVDDVEASVGLRGQSPVYLPTLLVPMR